MRHFIIAQEGHGRVDAMRMMAKAVRTLDRDQLHRLLPACKCAFPVTLEERGERLVASTQDAAARASSPDRDDLIIVDSTNAVNDRFALTVAFAGRRGVVILRVAFQAL